MEELVNDLKAQNDTLLAKLQSHASAEHNQKRTSGGVGDAQGNAVLQDRNKALSDQLLRSLESYKSLKRKYKDAKEENLRIRTTMEEIGLEVTAGLRRIRSFRQRMVSSKDLPADVEEEITGLEQMFERFNMKISNHEEMNIEAAKQKAEIRSGKPPLLA